MSTSGTSRSSEMNIRDRPLIKGNIQRPNATITRVYAPVEDSLGKAGLQSRKFYFFWGLLGLLSVLAWSNIAMTVAVFRVLRLGKGMEALELVPSARAVKFSGETDLGQVFKPDGNIDGYRYEPMEINGVRGQVSFEVADNKKIVRNFINVEHNGTEVGGITHFEVTDTEGRRIFTTSGPDYKLPDGVRNVATPAVRTRRVTSSPEDRLVVRGDTQIKLKGNEGATLEGRNVALTADQLLLLHSHNGSIVLSAAQGLQLSKLPIVTNSGTAMVAQYKICICMPHGKLFRVLDSITEPRRCGKIDQSVVQNPCM